MARKTIFLDRNTIRNLVDPGGCVDELESAVASLAQVGLEPPPKAIIDLGFAAEGGMAAAITGHLGGGRYLSMKLGQERPANPGRGLPTTASWISLFDIDTGELLAISDGGLPTMLRTGGMAALSARHMARPESKVLAVIGAGQLGECMVELVGRAMAFEKIYLVDAREEAALALAGVARSAGLPVEVASAEEACRAADVIATATTSRRPIVRNEWVRPGVHLACMGSDLPHKIELDPELTLRAHRIADEPAHSVMRGEVSQSVEAGRLGEDCFAGSIIDVVTGRVPGRRSPDEVTLYDGVGVGYQDTVLVGHLYEQAVGREHLPSLVFS